MRVTCRLRPRCCIARTHSGIEQSQLQTGNGTRGHRDLFLIPFLFQRLLALFLPPPQSPRTFTHTRYGFVKRLPRKRSNRAPRGDEGRTHVLPFPAPPCTLTVSIRPSLSLTQSLQLQSHQHHATIPRNIRLLSSSPTWTRHRSQRPSHSFGKPLLFYNSSAGLLSRSGLSAN